jgi:hypothetical protein
VRNDQLERIKSKVAKIGTGKKVEVKLLSNQTLIGTVDAIGDDQFTLIESPRRAAVPLRYQQVKSIKKPSSDWWAIPFGAAMIAGVIGRNRFAFTRRLLGMLNFVFKEFSGKCLLAIAMLLCLSGFVGAQTPAASWLTDVERAKFEKLRIAGSEALFNLDYEGARKNFKEMATGLSQLSGWPTVPG